MKFKEVEELKEIKSLTKEDISNMSEDEAKTLLLLVINTTIRNQKETMSIAWVGLILGIIGTLIGFGVVIFELFNIFTFMGYDYDVG